ncbi:MAG TPA: acireductone synthase [Nevskiaceae bacterium]|nr:acireductone synthase [Nevskiaceae bacterium]
MTIKAIITDIEGTTSSIDFVHQTLFPYAKAHLREFLRAHADDAEVQRQLIDLVRMEGRTLSIEQAADVLEKWMSEDRKATPLKALQGMIWKAGYDSGELTGHVYEDTPEYLERWASGGIRLYVYSSGSVEAQQLIFGNTEYGDLTPLFSGYFDTRVGGKRESASYAAILSKIGCKGDDVLFLSDIGEELDAARAAGLRTCQLLRDEKTKPSAAHPQARDFSQVQL